RDDLLEPVDEPVTRVERLPTMSRAHGDADARFADGNDADPVHHRHPAQRPAAARLPGELPHLAQRHPGERLVLEPGYAPPRVLAPRRAEEEHRRARRP